MSAVSFDAVSKSYGDVRALRDVSFDVYPGEVVSVLGPNGAGKTTAFEHMLGLSGPSQGDVRVLGRPPGGRGTRPRIGAMLQNAGLQEEITVRELVRLIGHSYPDARPVDEVLTQVDLVKRADRMVTDLSGGERQRTLLAMAIIGRPALLVLDEPTAAMDVAAKRAFWSEARASVGGGTTLVFATHDLAEADEVADRVIVLKNGSVVADATPSQLKTLVHGKVTEFVTNVAPDRVEALVAASRVELIPTGFAEQGKWRIEVHSDDPGDVIARLIAQGGSVDDLIVRNANLEDAFLELTGAAS